ncbi:unnamed protein product [Didymodactylos carnosus]|uniref:Cholesterol oxidase n=1 Tax=Didymodactylos carnosus TaxID=1234261 RepID=A0A814VF90_9BILA|nr:unnamed protein product [Didymodactylos carnosus]CAF1187379.1 unnamed protein product [Didymodactylos carnosus]CAF3758253.1 unnamed protein product [Didymodactylos carnosus]CAF3951644.1 unnamed protein product [Didymodactylos carnosus]
MGFAINLTSTRAHGMTEKSCNRHNGTSSSAGNSSNDPFTLQQFASFFFSNSLKSPLKSKPANYVWDPLSLPYSELKQYYSVCVIGSGYGGSIAASRCSRAGLSVCVLEKGKEFLPGEFPEHESAAMKEMNFSSYQHGKANSAGLYQIHCGKDVSIVHGCALGGTSQINANVALDPDEFIYDSLLWPKEIKDDYKTGQLKNDWALAADMLKPKPFDMKKIGVPAKYNVMKRLAETIPLEENHDIEDIFYTPPLFINMEDTKENHVGISQRACNGCGNCCGGCNTSAKNTLTMNYLPDARNHGAQIFTRCEVVKIEPYYNRSSLVTEHKINWTVHIRYTQSDWEPFGVIDDVIWCEYVFLGSGVLGTTELLLRSRQEAQLSLSSTLGTHFSGNGDILGYAANTVYETNGIGWPTAYPHQPPTDTIPGPTILTVIDRRKNKYCSGYVIEDGTAPYIVQTIYNLIIAISNGNDMFNTVSRGLKNSLSFLTMSHDNSGGRIVLSEHNHLTIKWKLAGESFQVDNVARQKELADTLDAKYVPDPIWKKFFGYPYLTVHPLGGCPLSSSNSGLNGVVNHKGQVFKDDTTDVYDTLYIVDASIIPCSIGVNPVRTICTLAERIMRLASIEHQFKINYSLPSTIPVKRSEPNKITLEFTERMCGWFNKDHKQPLNSPLEWWKYEHDNSNIVQNDKNYSEFTLTIFTDDLHSFINRSDHRAIIYGQVLIRSLSSKPFYVKQGEFNLFINSLTNIETKEMVYSMILRDNKGGEPYYWKGVKYVKNNDDLILKQAIKQTTTLYVTVWKGINGNHVENIVGHGIVRIEFNDFLKQLSTLKIEELHPEQNIIKRNCQKLKYGYEFIQFFCKSLTTVYLANLRSFNKPDMSMLVTRTRRELTVNKTCHYFQTNDHIQLLLIHFTSKEDLKIKIDNIPLLLMPGLNTKSQQYYHDTNEVTLVEYLVKLGYQVWTLDWRSSPQLPSHTSQYNFDQIAQYDIPASIEKLLQLTNSKQCNLFIHCLSSISTFMSLLGGYISPTCIRSILSNQVAYHIKATMFNRLKASIGAAELLTILGMSTVAVNTDLKHQTFQELIFSKFAKFTTDTVLLKHHEEYCQSDVCHRLTFIYSLLYKHNNLNTLTHQTIGELTGDATMEAFQHLEKMSKMGYVTPFNEKLDSNFYFGEDKRQRLQECLNIPIIFVTSEENSVWLPEGMMETYDELKQVNPNQNYQLLTLPNFGHLDSILGKQAHEITFPKFHEWFNQYRA